MKEEFKNLFVKIPLVFAEHRLFKVREYHRLCGRKRWGCWATKEVASWLARPQFHRGKNKCGLLVGGMLKASQEVTGKGCVCCRQRNISHMSSCFEISRAQREVDGRTAKSRTRRPSLSEETSQISKRHEKSQAVLWLQNKEEPVVLRR